MVPNDGLDGQDIREKLMMGWMGRSIAFASLSFNVFGSGWSNLLNITQFSTSLLGHMLVSCMSVSSSFVKALDR